MEERTSSDRPMYSSSQSVRGPLAYAGFLAASSLGIVLLLLGLVGSFFIGFFLFVIVALAVLIGLPALGLANLIGRARTRRRLAWEEGPLPASVNLHDVDTSVEENQVADVMARWNYSEVLAQIASDQVPESPDSAPETSPIQTPHDAVVAVVDTPEDLEGARRALAIAGFGDGAVYTYAPVPENVVPITASQAGTPKVRRGIRYALMEEEPMLDLYEDERREGHAVIVVNVAGRAQAQNCADILARHHARSIKYFGRWQITDMAPAELIEDREPVPLFRASAGPRPQAADLRRIDLFQGLAQAELEKIAAFCQIIDVPQGAILARQGEPGDSIFLVQSGQVELTTDSSQGELAVRIAGPGESFPLAALLGGGPLITSAIAASDDLRLIEVPTGPLNRLCASEPRIGMHIYRTIAEVLAERYRATLSRLTTTVDRGMRDMLRQRDLFANL